MSSFFEVILNNSEKVGYGVLLFLCAYLANMGLGLWQSIKLQGYDFDVRYFLSGIVKFAVLCLSLELLVCAATAIPMYSTYIGLELSNEVLQAIDGLIITGSFLTASIRYVTDALSKFKNILGLGENKKEK